MKINDLSGVIHQQPFFKTFTETQLALLTGCAKNQRFKAETMLAKSGTPADHFFVIRSGSIAIEIPVPGRNRLVIQTLGKDAIFGWSWIFPPYHWAFDGRCQNEVHALVFDGNCLRKKCDDNPDLGYKFMKEFAVLMSQRLEATRLQLSDVYGHPNQPQTPERPKTT